MSEYCSICKANIVIDKNNELFRITFNNLNGKPCICEKCIFEKLTGLSIDWIDTSRRDSEEHLV